MRFSPRRCPKNALHYGYNSIYSPQAVQDTESDEKLIFAIMHTENKNRYNLDTGERFENTILMSRSYRFPDEYSGPKNGRFEDYFPAYFAFITSSYSPASVNSKASFMQNQLVSCHA